MSSSKMTKFRMRTVTRTIKFDGILIYCLRQSLRYSHSDMFFSTKYFFFNEIECPCPESGCFFFDEHCTHSMFSFSLPLSFKKFNPRLGMIVCALHLIYVCANISFATHSYRVKSLFYHASGSNFNFDYQLPSTSIIIKSKFMRLYFYCIECL